MTTEAAAHRSRSRGCASLLDALPAELARNVFTHASWTPTRAESYERLAFLGDSVLSLAITSHIFPLLEPERFGAGELTKIRAQTVSGRSCRAVAERLRFRRARRCRARWRGSEHPEPGLDRARARLDHRGRDRCLLPRVRVRAGRAAVVEAFQSELADALENPVDFKSALQERLARRGALVSYAVVNESGPPHDRTFTIAARIGEDEIGRGVGRSKKDAEQAAAQEALARQAVVGKESVGSEQMYLKSITMKGFKSFPDRTRLDFGPGTSVIVGPNGSGKSNVTDAVLWALGEQSPMAVRGHSMQDVIFGGAPGRQAASSADGRARARRQRGRARAGPEVSILRRLDRNGEGEYRIGGAKCRLIDVIEVLSDTGLGKEMHSVISQGRVEAIVTSKPRDRRLLIEEAAGLGKHRKRRRRAQLKLGHTQDNLDRALDVEREARSRLKPLKRQAEAAELHERIHRQTLEVRWELARDELRARRVELAARDGAGHAGTRRARRRSRRSSRRSRPVGARPRRRWRHARAEREELSRRSYGAQSAADRVGYRAEAVRDAARDGRDRLERATAAARAAGRRGARPTSRIPRRRHGSMRSVASSRRWSTTAKLSSHASWWSWSSSALRRLSSRRERAADGRGGEGRARGRRGAYRGGARGVREAERARRGRAT